MPQLRLFHISKGRLASTHFLIKYNKIYTIVCIDDMKNVVHKQPTCMHKQKKNHKSKITKPISDFDWLLVLFLFKYMSVAYEPNCCHIVNRPYSLYKNLSIQF